MPAQKPYEHLAVSLARKNSDMQVLLLGIFSTVILVSSYNIGRLIYKIITTHNKSVLSIFITELVGWFIGMAVLGILLGLIMFVVSLQRQQFLANGLNVRHSEFAWLRDWADGLAKEIGMPPLEIFITQNPYLNAYAFGFMRPYCIVLHSAVVERLTKDELKAIVCHEMAHIRYGHTNISVYLAPFSQIPYFGAVINWLFGFWSRRAELTADRFAVAYFSNPKLVLHALLKIYMGPDVAQYVKLETLWVQLSESTNGVNKLSESLSSHPFLVHRALSIYNFAKEQNYEWHLTPMSHNSSVNSSAIAEK